MSFKWDAKRNLEEKRLVGTVSVFYTSRLEQPPTPVTEKGRPELVNIFSLSPLREITARVTTRSNYCSIFKETGHRCSPTARMCDNHRLSAPKGGPVKSVVTIPSWKGQHLLFEFRMLGARSVNCKVLQSSILIKK